jgi:hypothetical protein
MEWEFIAPMLVMLTLILTVGGVMVLRPIANRLGDLVEVLQQGRADPAIAQSLEHLTHLLEAQDRRLEALEERQRFTDDLLASRAEKALPGSPGRSGASGALPSPGGQSGGTADG